MAKKDYLPRPEGELSIWLGNYKTGITAVGATVGLTAGEVTALGTHCDDLIAGIADNDAAQNAAQQARAAKDAVKKLALDAIRPANRRIKAHTNCTEAITELLDIIGPEPVIDLPNLKPIINIVIKSGQPYIDWEKPAGVEAIEIFYDDAGVYRLLAIDSHPGYLDTRPLPAAGSSAIRNYKAIYRADDEQVGQWSDVGSVTVTGV